MRFQTPQFIETETKLVGPLTLRQFLFVVGGVSMSAMEVVVLSQFFAIVAVIPTLMFFAALAFFRVNGQPFLNYLAYMAAYSFGSKRYEYRPPSQGPIIPPHA